MSTFKEIRGTLIKSVSSDPANPQIGQIWYNSTIGSLKGYQSIGGAWAAGGNMSTAMLRAAAAGTQTAGLVFGGIQSTGDGSVTNEYDGTNWTVGGALTTARQILAGAGSQTAGLGFGGYGPPSMNAKTETYNGSSWTEVGDLNTARGALSGCGTQTAALAAGGYYILPPGNTSGYYANVEEWNGSSWTEVNNLPQVVSAGVGTGTQTAALNVGGRNNPPGGTTIANAYEYDGTNWTTGGSLGTATNSAGIGGSQTAAVFFGGQTPSAPSGTSTSQLYDGSSWTTTGSLATARRELSGQGTQTAALASGGNIPPPTNTSEEFTDPSFATQTLTTST